MVAIIEQFVENFNVLYLSFTSFSTLIKIDFHSQACLAAKNASCIKNSVIINTIPLRYS